MALDSSLGSATQEKSYWHSIGSVFDDYLIMGCGQFGKSCSLCSFNGNLEVNPWFKVIKVVLGGDLDDHEEVVSDDDDDDDDVLDLLPRDQFGNSCSLCSFNGNLEVNPWFEMIKFVLGGDLDDYEEVVIDDGVLDLLPRDPFGMNLESTFSSFSDWIEGFEWGEDGGFGMDGTREKIGDHLHFLGLSWGWNSTQNFNWEKRSAEEFLTVSHKNIWISSSKAEKPQNYAEIDSDSQGGVPHDALFFVLGYLGLKDLLSVEQVCKSLRDAVRGDPLLWRTLHIEHPLNLLKFTDDKLVKLTSRAQGTLQCLILLNCFMITDRGLGCVLQNNPRLMKLIVPDCIRLTIQNIIFNLRVRKSSGTPGIKQLRIGGRIGGCYVTEQQFEELKELMDASKDLQQRDQKPKFYRGGYSHIIHEDGRAIDVEMCPRCQTLKRVYDCPAESCQVKNQAAQMCRGCIVCIARCFHCGRCIEDYDSEETFCLDVLCMNCWNQLPHCPEKSMEEEATTCTITSQRTMYQFYLYG